jgi:hypothetical protein
MVPSWLTVGLTLLVTSAVGLAAPAKSKAQPVLRPAVALPSLSAGVRPAATARAKSDGTAQVRLVRGYGRLPLRFEANQGQTVPQVKFLSRGRGYSLFLTSTEAVLTLTSASRESRVESRKFNAEERIRQLTEKLENRQLAMGSPAPRPQPLTPAVLHLKLVGANAAAKITGVEELATKSNYFIGSDPKKWRAGVSSYSKVRYQEVYPGVDLVYYGNQGQLEYDFVVAPGADPRAIALAIETGQSQIQNPKREIVIAANGDLVVDTGSGEVRLHKPVVYQVDNRQSSIDKRQFLDGRYVLRPAKTGKRDSQTENRRAESRSPRLEVAFEIPSYDPRLPLIIDPALSYSTFLGGSDSDTGYGVAVDADGNLYVTGSTGSIDFPTASPYQAADGGDFDVFVTKLNPAGTALVYSTYLGGSGFDRGTAIAVDAAGNAYLTGMTASNNFPTTSGAFQTTFGDGTCGTAFCSDAFVTKLDPTGATLLYSTYLGGADADFGQGIAIDAAGNAHVTGSTLSTNFPTVAPLQAASAGNSDVFLTKLGPDGKGLVYSTYLGGANGDFGQAVAVDSAGNAYLTGYTFSSEDFPTYNPLHSTNAGSADVFVTEVDPAGAALVYSTYLGGSGLDRAFALAVDGSGNAYLTGDTNSPDFPISGGALQPLMGGGTCGAAPCADAFAAKLSSAGSALAYSTYLGGVDLEQGSGIAVDASGNAFVTGFTRSDDFPTLHPLQSAFGGGTCGPNACPDAFVAELDVTGSGLVYSTYLGGDETDFGQAIAVDATGNAYVTGNATSHNFPVIAGAIQAARGGGVPTGDAFVAKITPDDVPAVALFPQTLTFSDRATGFTSPAQTVTLINSGSASLSIISIVANGDFGQTNGCGSSVAAGGATCTIDITFTPTATGTRTGDVTITDDAAGTPHVISLTGTGIAPASAVTLSPSPLTFPDQTFGITSAVQTITLTSSGTAGLTITSIAVSGDFAQTNNCPVSPATVAVDGTCTIDVTFTPTATGARTGTITVTDDATASPHTVSLSGNGIAVFSLSATATSVIVTRGTDSASFTVSATAPSEFTSSITLGCTSNTPATCTFNPTSITAGQSSTLTVSGLKQVTQAALNFKATGVNGTQSASVDLSVLFADFSLTVYPTFTTVAAGDSVSATLTITPSNGFTGAVTFSCVLERLPQATTCTFSPDSVTLDGTNPATTVATIHTTTRTAAPPSSGPWSPLPWLLGLMVFATLAKLAQTARRRAPAFMALTAAILLLALFLASCGENYYQIRGTPQGTYSIYVQGKSGDATNYALISLTVT